MWTHYNNEAEIINNLKLHVNMLKKGDHSKVIELAVLFLPTSDLQELSKNDGWNEQFLEIAAEFSKIINEIDIENLKNFKKI